MRWIAMFLLAAALLTAACASSSDQPERPVVEVTSSQEFGGQRIQFRLREGDVTDAPVTLSADQGDLRDPIRSSNLRNMSVLWDAVDGKLTCVFPQGQAGEYDAALGVPLADVFIYTFFSGHGVDVTSRLGRGAPMVPRLLLRVTVPKEQLPAELQWEGREPHHLVQESSLLLVDLPQSDKHVLATGDWNVALRTAKGSWSFLIGVDPDGTPSASSGFVRQAKFTEVRSREG